MPYRCVRGLCQVFGLLLQVSGLAILSYVLTSCLGTSLWSSNITVQDSSPQLFVISHDDYYSSGFPDAWFPYKVSWLSSGYMMHGNAYKAVVEGFPNAWYSMLLLSLTAHVLSR